MSLVRISKQLLVDVDKVIAGIKAKDHAVNVEPLDPANVPAITEALWAEGERIIWGEYMYLKPTLPQGWLDKIDRMDVSVLDQRKIRIGAEIMISKPVYIPPHYNHGYGYVEVKIPQDKVPPEFHTQHQKYEAAANAFQAKYEAIQTQVLGFLKSCKSLNDALKRYPDIALYVPEKYLSIVNEAKERTIRTKQERERAKEVVIDRDMISSTGVLGKLQS